MIASVGNQMFEGDGENTCFKAPRPVNVLSRGEVDGRRLFSATGGRYSFFGFDYALENQPSRIHYTGPAEKVKAPGNFSSESRVKDDLAVSVYPRRRRFLLDHE
jgi:hypothetical protein